MKEKEFYVVYTGKENKKPAAILFDKGYSESLIRTKSWYATGYYEKISKKDLLKLIEEEF
jgi:hypothetical protein